MVETIVTIERGCEVRAALVGAVCGVVVARLGGWGLVCAGPMLALVTFAALMTLKERLVLTAELAFAAGCVGALAVLR